MRVRPPGPLEPPEPAPAAPVARPAAPAPAPDLLSRANRAAGGFARQLNGRLVGVAVGLGVVGAFLTGSAPVALAPLLLLIVAQLLWAQSVQRLVVFAAAATLWLDDPSEVPYAHRWTSPFQPLGNLWFHTLQKSFPAIPVPLTPATLLVAWALLRAITTRLPRLDPMGRQFLRACAGAVVVVVLAEGRGVMRGGDLHQSFYQILPLLTTVGIAATTCLAASRTLLRNLERVLLLAAGARAVVCIYVYVTVFRPLHTSFLYVSTHGDSVLWVVALALLVGRITTTFRLEPQRGRVALAFLLLVAITVNNRRLAWVELGVVVVYASLATPPRLRRLRGRVAMAALPVLAVYTVVGLSSPPSRIFTPVQALNSVNDEEDSSTKSRDVENYNLIATIREAGPLGMGFGHQYDEQVIGPDISKAFAQYRYLPHNSVLGLWAFGGIAGFIGYWLPLVLGMASAARLRQQQSQHLRAAGIWFAGGIIAFSLMAWGDIGLQTGVNGMIGGLAAGLAVGIAREAAAPWRRGPRTRHAAGATATAPSPGPTGGATGPRNGELS